LEIGKVWPLFCEKSFLWVIMTCHKLPSMFGGHLKSIVVPPDGAEGHLKLLGKLLHFHKSNFFFVQSLGSWLLDMEKYL
jgi:hypothetical protein